MFFVIDRFAFFFDGFLLNCKGLNPVADLISHPSESPSYLLVALKDEYVLGDRLEEMLAELFDFVCVDDILAE